MRSVWPVLWVFAASCAGGQTGEIYRPPPDPDCVAVVDDSVEVDEAVDGGTSLRDELARFPTSVVDVGLVWSDLVIDGPRMLVSASFALTNEPGVRIGGPECELPRTELPITLTFTSDDGSFDEVLPGTLVITAASYATARATAPLGALNGTLDLATDPAFDPAQTTLRIGLFAFADGMECSLALEPEPPSPGAIIGGFSTR